MTSPTIDTVAAPSERIRSELANAISEAISSRGWTQKSAATALGRTQPDISDLLRGVTDRLSLDAMMDMALALTIPIRVDGPEGTAVAETAITAGALRRKIMAQMAAYMESRGMTLDSAADELGTNAQRISDIRSGRTSRISLSSTLTLAENHFGIRVSVPAGAA